MELLLPKIDRFPIEAGHIMMFARAIGDPNPIYCDEAYAKRTSLGGIIAPPTFVDAGWHYFPDFQFRPRPSQRWWGSGREASGGAAPDAIGGGSSLFVANELTFFRPLRPGMVLTVIAQRGRTWEKDGRRAGRLAFREVSLEYRDHASDELYVSRSMTYVLTEHAGSPARAADAPMRSAEAWRPPDFPNYPVQARDPEASRVGEVFEERLISDLSRAQIAMYAGASGDFAPHHVDEVYTTRIDGYRTVFAPGMLTMAMLGRLATDWLGDGRLRRLGVRFRRQVWAGDSVTGRLVVVGLRDEGDGKLVDLRLEALNQTGECVADGHATGVLLP
jgi:acyl dehydratase